MAILKLETKGFDEMIRKLEALGGNVEAVVEKSLEQASEQISNDTKNALSSAHLPARGKYSSGDTEKSIVSDHRVYWEGTTAWVPVGFDFSKPGAGGFLISGTPKYDPDPALNKIYRGTRYMKGIQQKMRLCRCRHRLSVQPLHQADLRLFRGARPRLPALPHPGG